MAKLRGICSDAIHWQYRQQARRANGMGRVENILTQIEANNYPLLPDIYLVRFHYLRFRSKRELAGPEDKPLRGSKLSADSGAKTADRVSQSLFSLLG